MKSKERKLSLCKLEAPEEKVKQCPLCGSKEIQTCHIHGESIGVEFGPAIVCTLIEDMCFTCGETGDFEAVNDAMIEKCQEISERMRIALDKGN